MARSSYVLLTAILLLVGLSGCDAVGSEDTVILNHSNSDTDSRPTITYTFAYDTNGKSSIAVRSNESDDLDDILANAGFSRDDVISATVDSVHLERRSDPGSVQKEYVFDYLTGAAVYLGDDAEGVRIAESAFDTNDRVVPLDVRTSDVTSVVKNGPTPAFLQLDAGNDVPDRRDRVAVTVYYEVKLSGV